jgi:hypothetical protein
MVQPHGLLEPDCALWPSGATMPWWPSGATMRFGSAHKLTVAAACLEGLPAGAVSTLFPPAASWQVAVALSAVQQPLSVVDRR